MTFRFRGQVEGELGRSLTQAELKEVASIDELSDDQIAAIAAIRQHNRIAPMLYVKAIVPTADHADVMRFIDEDIQRIATERRPPGDLPKQRAAAKTPYFINCDMSHRKEEQMNIDPTDRGRIENWLDRPLTDEELLPVESLDMLSDDQVAVVAAIQPRNRIAPLLFLHAVVPTAKRLDLVDYIENIEDVYVVRFPPPELPDQRIFEHYAGRPLEPAERVRAGTVYKMTSAQVGLAKTLALKDLTVAFLYLSRVAPDDTIEQRHHLAKHLAGLV
jgi:hypothetical protein